MLPACPRPRGSGSGSRRPGREYLVLLTHLPLRRLSRLPRFLADVRGIRRQLDGTDGLVGYSLLAKPLRSDYWTLSAWEDEAALGRFVRESPHRESMAALGRAMAGFDIVRWTAPGTSLPPTWDEALARRGG